MKAPSKKEEAPASPDKVEGAASPQFGFAKLGIKKDDNGKNGATSENASKDETPTAPFEPEMLPHLDMSEKEIGYKDAHMKKDKTTLFEIT